MNKNFKNLKILLENLNYKFSVICLTETWCRCGDDSNSNFYLSGYKSIHQPRKKGLGGGVCIFILDSLIFKRIEKHSINNADCESITVEIINQKAKNTFITALYRPPDGKLDLFGKHLTQIIPNTSKNVYIAGDFNINLLNINSDSNVKRFVNTLLQHGFMPLINKPTRVTHTTSSIIDNIITNNYMVCKIESGIIKSDISDHFPNFLITNHLIVEEVNSLTTYVREINNNSIKKFRNFLLETDWEFVTKCNDANNAYDLFIRLFYKQYEKAFPKIKKIIHSKNLRNPWMTKGLKKSSRKKQKLYDNYLKNKTLNNEIKYKKYKNSFEKLKKQAKKNYYSNLLEKSIGNVKKKWNIIKEVVGNKQVNKNTIPKRLQTEMNKDVFDKNEIANMFNNFFINIGKNLAESITPGNKSFKSFLKKAHSVMDESEISSNELRTALNFLKINKSPGLDDINSSVLKSVFDIIESPLLIIFNLSLKTGVFPDKLKIARVVPSKHLDVH
jgi:hypothetical protein